MKQLHCQHQKVIKIHRIVLAQPFLVLFIGVRDPLLHKTYARIFFAVLQRRDELVLGRGDLR